MYEPGTPVTIYFCATQVEVPKMRFTKADSTSAFGRFMTLEGIRWIGCPDIAPDIYVSGSEADSMLQVLANPMAQTAIREVIFSAPRAFAAAYGLLKPPALMAFSAVTLARGNGSASPDFSASITASKSFWMYRNTPQLAKTLITSALNSAISEGSKNSRLAPIIGSVGKTKKP